MQKGSKGSEVEWFKAPGSSTDKAFGMSRKHFCMSRTFLGLNVGALIIRIALWGPLYYIHNEEPPSSIGKYLRPYTLTGPKPTETKAETFRIDYLIRTQKVEKLSLQPISIVR